jgi:hypothetical protein
MDKMIDWMMNMMTQHDGVEGCHNSQPLLHM